KEAANDIDDVVGVDGSEHEVTRERRLNCYLCGFGVADLADHYLVGIMTKYAAQSAREGQPLFLVHRNLGYPLKLVFDGVFDCDDLVFLILDLVERSIKSGRFSGT